MKFFRKLALAALLTALLTGTCLARETFHGAYLQGFPDGSIRPDAAVTRAELAEILYRMMEPEQGRELSETEREFADVPTRPWAYDAICAMAGARLMLGGSAVDSNVAMVEKGFRKIMEDNQVTILDSMHADGWKAELAGAYIYEQMDVVSEADAIMCGNDDLASKVVHALKEKRLAGDIMVVGQDADLEACQRIVEGTQVMTVYKPVEKMSQKAAECAVLLAKGEPLPEGDTVTIENGKYEVPYIGLEPISVDKNNMNDVIIGSGFHLKEDVYLNIPSEMPK